MVRVSVFLAISGSLTIVALQYSFHYRVEGLVIEISLLGAVREGGEGKEGRNVP